MKTISFRFKYEDKKLQEVLLEDSRICSAMRKRMVPTEFCIKTEVDAGSRKPMEGRTRIGLSILERTIWRNQRTETQISVPATSSKCCL